MCHACGRLSWQPAVRDHLPAFLPQLAANAEEMCFEDFTATVDHFVTHADVDGAHDARDDAVEHRRARVDKVGAAFDASAFGGDGVTADEMIDIFQTFCDKEFEKDFAERRDLHGDTATDHDLPRTAVQRSFDALLAIFRTAANAATAGHAAATVVNIVIDAATFGRILAAAGLVPTTLDVIAVDPFTGLLAPNTLLSDLMSDPAQLDSIRCETDRGVLVHADDAGVLCSSHNRAKHRLKLRRRRGVNGVGYTIRANGTVIVPFGARTPQFPAEDDPDDRPDTPDEIAELASRARQRLHAELARERAA